MITILWGFSLDMELTGPSLIFEPKSGLTLCGLTLCGQSDKKSVPRKVSWHARDNSERMRCILGRLGLELVGLERDGSQVIGTWFESELYVPLFPAIGLSVDSHFVKFVLGFVP